MSVHAELNKPLAKDKNTSNTSRLSVTIKCYEYKDGMPYAVATQGNLLMTSSHVRVTSFR